MCISRELVGPRCRRPASVVVEGGARPYDSSSRASSSDDDASVANDDDDDDDDANQRIAATKMVARAAWPRCLRDKNRDDDDEGVNDIA